MKVRVIATLVMALCLAVGSASASSIGAYFASDASDCDGSNGQFTQGTLYIIAVLGGDALATGLTTAEFRMDGFPAGWFPTVTANPAANVTLGGPLTGGCNIGFPACQTGGGRVVLYTISYFATSVVDETYLTVDRHTSPSNPLFMCALATQCDENFTKVCVPGGQAILNGGPCTVGVDSKSWAQVKSLYGN
jgi:hypothetical protein